ncbi:uncharacterized protein PITG_02325 [Phytophthora infestans T30-4]|uniref:HMA domain-containing protein n=1 Tax=Phytophthora infestans (strain T30-4) TaxID=403677 RepID=D0MW15_PHYIT|nr:uncharacterized protein PITG_02325 [Phytophthora infestans T30-4]EEY63828.1 conserved hypothetical protein [Phytophthora infestans T30-4]|eukprot:XP_002907264.1 conserved hypothetical protein [Phytophthora infestans T30-4]
MQTRRAAGSSSVAAVSASAAVAIAPASTPKIVSKKRTRRQCSNPDCTKVDAGGGFCVAHGGGKKCSFPGCTKGYQTGGFCRQHGGGARCQVDGCGKVDAGRGLCRAHGGGRRCQIANCPKADVGGGRCTAHGGGKRCSEPGCTKIDQGGGKCRAHGGARRCRRRNCQQPARGSTGFCPEHGGARVCSVLSCRRLVRSPNDTGTMCATCARSQKQRAAVKPTQEDNSDHSNESPRNSAIPTPEGSGASVLASFIPLSPNSANARCDGSQAANCLDNGCARSFGGNCNCVEGCTCNSPTSLSTSRMLPMLASSNTITRVAASTNQTIGTEFEPLGSPTPRATMMPRAILQIKPHSNLMGIETIMAMLGSRLVAVRGGQSLDLEKSLAPLNTLQVAEINVIEQSTTSWTRKEVVLRVPDMMCPANCGSSVLNAIRALGGVEAARLRFEHRQIVIRGDMNVDAIQTAVSDIGFDSEVNAETPLPRRFRFRVDDLGDVGLNGVKLKDALKAVEGVENLVLLTDRVEVLVVAMLLDASPLLKAAERVGFEMLELSEEAWGIPMEVVPTSSSDTGSNSTNEYYQSHKCDMRVCPQNGCPRYMTTVAHTAALAVGWAVPGCGMSVGGECTCGDSCKCVGCPEHNPVS